MAADDRNERPDLREQADVEPRTRRDMREADRAGDAGRETTAGRTAGAVAKKIRALRKKAAKRSAKKKSEKLKQRRRRREKPKPIREEVEKLAETGSVKKALGAAKKAGAASFSAASKIGADSDVGARGRPGTREDDPAVRAGEAASAGAPVDATLHPFGTADQPAGPQYLEVLAGGGPRAIREARRQEMGVADLEAFAAAGGIDRDATYEPDGGADAYTGNPLVVDTDPLFDVGTGGEGPTLDEMVTGGGGER